MRAFLAAVLLLLSLGAQPVAADPSNRTRSIANVVVSEGGWTTDKRDPGNRGGTGTLNGVIQRVYDEDRALRGLPRKLLSRSMLGTPEWIEERDDIFGRRYWTPCAGPDLSRGLDYILLDMCVNSGIGRGWSTLMKVLGLVQTRPWSRMPDVLAGIEHKGARAVIRAYGDERRRFYRGLASRAPYNVFLSGWLNRETHSRTIALRMEAGLLQASGASIAPSNLPMAKAYDSDDMDEVQP